MARDENIKGWLCAIELEKMEWAQINAFDKIKDFDLVKEFAVSGFSTKNLIDLEGKILKRFIG